MSDGMDELEEFVPPKKLIVTTMRRNDSLSWMLIRSGKRPVEGVEKMGVHYVYFFEKAKERVQELIDEHQPDDVVYQVR